MIEWEPTVDNYDQEFGDAWYSKLKLFSLTLMKDIVAHCDKTIFKIDDDIKDTETREKYNRIRRISVDWKNYQKQWSKHQTSLVTIKVQKVNYLIDKPNSTTEKTPPPTKHKRWFQKTPM